MENKNQSDLSVISVKYSNYAACEEYLYKGPFKIGDSVLIYSQRGLEIGTIEKKLNKKVEHKIPYIQGLPSQAQITEMANFRANENKTIDKAQELADNLKLVMTFVGAEHVLDQKTLFLYFEAENRVDFRQLLKDLAATFSVRIELTQIGARVSAGFIGGIGICGHSLCCATFLKKFDTVTLNKAKNQNLALNTQKLSGKCGRLKCCLSYEDDLYTQEKKHLPNVGKRFRKDGKEYVITSVNVLSKVLKCESGDDVEFFPLNDVQKFIH